MSDERPDFDRIFDAEPERTPPMPEASDDMFEPRAHTPAWLNDYAQPSKADEVMVRMAAQRAAYDAGAAERQQRDAERAASHAELRRREEERLAAEQAEVERQAEEQAITGARLAADKAEREALWQAQAEALERQDDDYRALAFRLDFKGRNIPGYDEPLDDSMRIDLSELSDDAEHNARAERELRNEISAALDELCALYLSMGLVRMDNLGGVTCDGLPRGAPTFLLVYGATDEMIHPELLAEFAERRIASQAVPGASFTFSVIAQHFNATTLFERATQHSLAVGEWCEGSATPDFAPDFAENRDEWLARIMMPTEEVHRYLARRKRSGDNIELFKAAGAADGKAARKTPIRWLIPGLVPRGYVTLLVGTKQAGKSTLLGEMIAVIDSECQSRRAVLGGEVTERGVGAIVSGEDGIDFVANRNTYYEPVHGDALGFTFTTSHKPWREILELINEIPQVDIIGIDPLRAVMPGNEDSSEAISEFLTDLNALAQRKDCAIVLVHHLSKTTVRTLSAMLAAVRGSAAITDRPRMVIGMIHRGGDITEVGIIKHNIPPSETLWGEVNVGRLFRRDRDTLTLIPVEAIAGRGDPPDTADRNLDHIFEAVQHQNRLGVTLRRTGKSELWELRLPQLIGLSRHTIRESIATLIAAGRLADGADGIQAIRVEPA